MDNEQNEGDNDNNNKKKKKEAKQNRFSIPFVSKAKKRIVLKIKRKPSSLNVPSSSSSSSSSSSGFWKKVCFCGIESSNSFEWSSSSSHDPEDVNFTLRVLLQTNGFFSKDCNPHLSLVIMKKDLGWFFYIAMFQSCSMPLYPCVRHDLPLNSAALEQNRGPRDSRSKVCLKNCWSIVQRKY